MKSEWEVYDVIRYLKESYQTDIEITWKSLPSNSPCTEKEIIFSRAVARFQHLMILKEQWLSSDLNKL